MRKGIGKVAWQEFRSPSGVWWALFLARGCTGHSLGVHPQAANLSRFGIRSGAFLIRLVASLLQGRTERILLESGDFRPGSA
jgi:hypothetical protein